jgi:hypothetical protein
VSLLANAAEVVGRAAERHRHVQAGEAGIDDIEQRRVFDREEARDPVVVRVVDDEAGLQTADVTIP